VIIEAKVALEVEDIRRMEITLLERNLKMEDMK
jgi:hypothetical protein